jgi:hypothetical protein
MASARAAGATVIGVRGEVALTGTDGAVVVESLTELNLQRLVRLVG